MTRRAALTVHADSSNHVGVDVVEVESNRVELLTLVNRHALATHEVATAGDAWDIAESAVRLGVGDCGTHVRRGCTSRPISSGSSQWVQDLTRWHAPRFRIGGGSMPPSAPSISAAPPSKSMMKEIKEFCAGQNYRAEYLGRFCLRIHWKRKG